MKKGFKYYMICWLILVVALNVVIFVTPAEVGGYSKFAGAFWASYAIAMLAFVGQLICARIAFKETDRQRFFYKVPLITVSYTGLIVAVVVAAVCFAVPNLPNWVAAVLGVIVLAVAAVSVVKADAAAETVAAVDEKVKAKTAFIKLLTVDAESLLARAKTDEAKAATKKVYEAIRYSDPMSSDALADVEAEIKEKFSTLTQAIASGEDAAIAVAAQEVCLLVGERNKKCKVLK